MIKIIVAFVFAAGLFVTGAFLLKSANDTSKKTVVVYDYDPYCDENSYLDYGHSETTIGPIKDENNEPPEELEFASCPNSSYHVIEDGQTLHNILKKLGISEQEIALLGKAYRPFLWASDLTAGDCYRYEINNEVNTINKFIIRKVDPNRVPILYIAQKKQKENFVVEVKEPSIHEELSLVELTVTGTLYDTFNKLPYGTELMQRLMATFKWQIDMPKEIARGDIIEILVVKKFTLGNFIGYGPIKSARYQQKSRSLFATWFASSDGQIKGYFDEQGRSLEREFLVSAVPDAVVTSENKWRLHPIRKIRIKHNGDDIRGPIGTEFVSIADGEVVEKRFDKNVGNMIRIRHKYGVHSEYFHADQIMEHLSVGSKVKRGQIIGTIGRTGRLCTGPHLHMGLYKLDGEKRRYLELSSLKKILRPANDIPKNKIAEFSAHVKSVLAQVKDKKQPAIATALTEQE